MSLKKLIISAFTVVLALSAAGFGQETETKVVDEVVAQVNDGVITLSRVKREKKGIIDSYKQEGKTQAEAEKLVADKEGELIAGLINEELLIQRSKEIGLDSEIETAINARFLEIMKENKVTTLDQLYTEMEKQGVDPQEIREMWRKQMTRERVVQRDLQSRVYWEPNEKAVRAYYDAHKDKFTKPETVTISDIFLNFAGRDEAAVRAKAAQLVQQLRGGGDFTKAIAENSDRQGATDNKPEPMPVSELNPKFADAVKNLKVGGITDPIEVDNVGLEILRLDARDVATSESVFDDNAVRLAMLQERLPAETPKYMSKLRKDAFIKISDTYRPLVSPILFADERADGKDVSDADAGKKADSGTAKSGEEKAASSTAGKKNKKDKK